MSIYLLISAIAMLLYVQLGVYIFSSLPIRRVTIYFLLAALLYALIALSILLINLLPETNLQHVYDRLAVHAIMILPLVFALLTFHLHSTWKGLLSGVIHYVLLPAAILFGVRYHIDPETFYVFSEDQGTWAFTLYPSNPWRIALIVYYLLCEAVILFQLVSWRMMATTRRSRHQAELVLLAAVLFFLASVTTDLFLPALGFSNTLFLSHLLALPALAVMAYALIVLGSGQFTDSIVQNLLVREIPGHVIVFDAAGHILFANQHTLQSLVYGQFTMQELKVYELFEDPETYDFINQKARLGLSVAQMRISLKDGHGQTHVIEINTIPIHDRLRRFLGFVLAGTDVSHLVQLESKLAALEEMKRDVLRKNREVKDLIDSRKQELAMVNARLGYTAYDEDAIRSLAGNPASEKAWLVREMHHRVKNNLQIILSLAKMLASDMRLLGRNEKVMDSITSRIMFLSEIHDSFYSSPFLSKIDFSAYIRQMLDFFQTKHNSGTNIQYTVNTHEVKLSIQQALPCAVILNEMLENACLLAFPDDFLMRKGRMYRPTIQVSCTSNDNYVNMWVLDNGLPYVSSVEHMPEGAGLRMIRQLAACLSHGAVQITSAYGTYIEVSFKEDSPL